MCVGRMSQALRVLPGPCRHLEPARMRHSLVEVPSRLGSLGDLPVGSVLGVRLPGGRAHPQMGAEGQHCTPSLKLGQPPLSPEKENGDLKVCKGHTPPGHTSRAMRPPGSISVCTEKHRAVLPSVWGGGGAASSVQKSPLQPPALGLWSPPPLRSLVPSRL